jgi:hypothetical protein
MACTGHNDRGHRFTLGRLVHGRQLAQHVRDPVSSFGLAVTAVYRKPCPCLSTDRIGQVGAMIALVCFVLVVLTSPFKSRSRLEAENAALRHQLAVLRRKLKGRAQPRLLRHRDLGAPWRRTRWMRRKPGRRLDLETRPACASDLRYSITVMINQKKVFYDRKTVEQLLVAKFERMDDIARQFLLSAVKQA